MTSTDIMEETVVCEVAEVFRMIFSHPPHDEGMLDKISSENHILGQYRNIWKGIVQRFAPSAHRITAFVRRIPGFCKLNSNDQTVLLRSCVLEILYFRLGSRYNRLHGSLPIRNFKYLTKVQAMNLFSGDLWPFLKPLFDTALKVSTLKMSVTQSALSIAILAMDPGRVGLRDVESVNTIKVLLTNALKRHLRQSYPEASESSLTSRCNTTLGLLATIKEVCLENADWLIHRRASTPALLLSTRLLEDAY